MGHQAVDVHLNVQRMNERKKGASTKVPGGKHPKKGGEGGKKPTNNKLSNEEYNPKAGGRAYGKLTWFKEYRRKKKNAEK